MKGKQLHGRSDETTFRCAKPSAGRILWMDQPQRFGIGIPAPGGQTAMAATLTDFSRGEAAGSAFAPGVSIDACLLCAIHARSSRGDQEIVQQISQPCLS